MNIKILTPLGIYRGASDKGFQYYQLQSEDNEGNMYLCSLAIKIHLTESAEKTFGRLRMVAAPVPAPAPVDELDCAVKSETTKENPADQTHSEGITTEEKEAIQELPQVTLEIAEDLKKANEAFDKADEDYIKETLANESAKSIFE
jgi:hypothetical protein